MNANSLRWTIRVFAGASAAILINLFETRPFVSVWIALLFLAVIIANINITSEQVHLVVSQPGIVRLSIGRFEELIGSGAGETSAFARSIFTSLD